MENILNSAFVNGQQDRVCFSLHIPQLSSVKIVEPENNYPDIPETDFAKKIGDGGLGITDGDLYYITVPIGAEAHIITRENKRVIIECDSDGVKEINF